MIKRFKEVMLILCVAGCISVKAQLGAKHYPIIGKVIPEFRLTNVHYYSKKSFDPRELKGKWIILDFWHKGCVGCIRSFPKVNQLQEDFKEQVQFLLVGRNDFKYNMNIEQVYERYRRKLGLELAVAFDSTLIEQFGISIYPYIIVIDPQSIVYAITTGEFLTKENIQDLVNNRNPSFTQWRGDLEQKDSVFFKLITGNWKYLMDGDEKRDFIYRSVLSKNEGGVQTGSWSIDDNVDRGVYQITRVNLSQLYNIAYLGKTEWHRWMPMYKDYWAYPVLDVHDSSDFQFNPTSNDGFYNYSLIVPRDKATKEHLMEVMQGDLKNCFGYEVSLETRMMPYWKLTATEQAREKLRTSSGVVVDKREPTGMDCKRIPLGLVLSDIEKYNSDGKIPFIDETNITGPIDIKFNAVMTDIDDVKKALKRQGLLLEKGWREMKVLMIRDAPAATRSNG